MNIELMQLVRYDRVFLKTLKDHEKFDIRLTKGSYHTILVKNKKVGIIGYTPINDRNLFQLMVNDKFHTEYIGAAIELLIKENNLTELSIQLKLYNEDFIKEFRKEGVENDKFIQKIVR